MSWPVGVGSAPVSIAITPDGTKAYVANSSSNNVTPIILATGATETAIGVGSGPIGIAITPDGTKAYVANFSDNNVSQIIIGMIGGLVMII